MNMASGLKEKKVLITGGTGSVGKALVEGFSTQGAEVTFQYKDNQHEADKLVEYFRVSALQVDLKREFVIDDKFDIVVNNAGINISDVITHEVSFSDLEETLYLNVSVPFRLAKLCLPYMINKRWGRIVNISSIYGLRATEGNLPYTISKHALSGMTKTIAKEYAQYGITCNEICPGPIDSEMMKRIGMRESNDRGISLSEYFKEIVQEIPCGRMADPKDVASLAIYIASKEAAYLNGASIPLDGGLIA